MTATTKIKLILTGRGTYRTKSGSVLVVQELKRVRYVSDEDRKWSVSWKNGLDCSVKKYFATLAECREYVNNGDFTN